jgi:hypothetical protein
MSIRVDIEAKDEKEAEQICQNMDVNAICSLDSQDELFDQDRLHCEIIDQDDLREDEE